MGNPASVDRRARVFDLIRKFCPLLNQKCSAECTCRNKETLPLCGIAAARKVLIPLRIEGNREAEAGLPARFVFKLKL